MSLLELHLKMCIMKFLINKHFIFSSLRSSSRGGIQSSQKLLIEQCGWWYEQGIILSWDFEILITIKVDSQIRDSATSKAGLEMNTKLTATGGCS